ncbi:hypothetical protein J4E80_010633 [Alternaria sp. BMP 0032]|nr:hypothetical protein J4E80_010633 [Alternaria sp. BMP 0032]
MATPPASGQPRRSTRTFARLDYAEPSPESEDGEHLAECVLQEERREDGVLWYEVKWAGTEPKTGLRYDPSWIPADGANKALKKDWERLKRLLSSIQVKEWIGSCLYPFSGQGFGLSIQENLEGEGLKPPLDLRVAFRFPEFSQDLEKDRKGWLLSIRLQSRDNFANLVSIFGQHQKVSPQLLKCPQCLGKWLPRRGQCHPQHCDVALYCPEVN